MKKTLIIVLISCFGIFIVLTLILNSKDENYIIFDNNLFLSINDGRVSEISSDLLFDRDYNAFYQKEYIGKYELHSIDDEFGKLFFSNSKSDDTYSFETPYLAITPGIKFIPFEVVDADIDDLSLLSFDLDKYWISSIDDLNVFKKVIFDVDNDDVDETVYYASYWNYLDTGADLDKSFSITFLVDNNKVYVLDDAVFYGTSLDDDEVFYTMDNVVLEYLLEVDGSIVMVVASKSIDVSFYSLYEFNDERVINYYS